MSFGWTEEQGAELVRRLGKGAKSYMAAREASTSGTAPAVQAKAHRRRHEPGVMNKLEAEYAAYLQLDPRVTWWGFECVRLQLAIKTWYLPDFLVLTVEHEIEVHEVKGKHWEDDARVKAKTAAEIYPFFRWIAVQRDAGGWQVEEFPSKAGRITEQLEAKR